MDFVLKCVGKVIWIKRRFKGKVDPPTRNKAWFAFYVLRAHPSVDLVTAKALNFPDDYSKFLLVVISVWSLLPSSLKMSPDWLIARTLSSALKRLWKVHERASELFRTLVNLWNRELHRFFTVNILEHSVCIMYFSFSTEEQHLLKCEQSKETDGSSSPHTSAQDFSVGL